MFFSPSRAVLSAILRDEYLTSAVRAKEGDTDQLSQHDRSKNLNQSYLRYACQFKSTNQRIATKQTSLSGAGLWF